MALPGVPRTFALENCRDVLDKLMWEIEGFQKESPQDVAALAYRAFNGAVTAWHVLDWIWHDLTDEQRAALDVEKLIDLQNLARRQCRALHLCRQVATASKHRVITAYPDTNVNTAVSAKSMPPPKAAKGMISVIPPVWRVKIIDGNVQTDAIDVLTSASSYLTEMIYGHQIAQ